MRVPSGSPVMPQPPPPRKASPAKPLDFVVLILLPWLIFSLIICLFAFAYEDFGPLVWALVASSGLLALLFVSMGGASGRVAQLALGFLVLTSVAVAVPVGLFVENGYMQEYWRLDSGAKYQHVSPTAPGASYADASVLEFEQGTFVDVQRSLGYMKLGDVYCVAPILGPGSNASTAPQYWAAGKDCCSQRGAFSCGDVADASARSGVAVDDGDFNYRTAVRMAVSAYELTASPALPTFVRWTSDPAAYKDTLWSSTATLAAMASGIHLVGSAGASLLLSRGLLR